MIKSEYDIDWLLKLRLVVARCGEADCLDWWNTRGQMSRLGATVLSRGFPRTHNFAQARSTISAAATRCAEVFDMPGALTIWWLGDSAEEAFDLQWEVWLDNADEWNAFFADLAKVTTAPIKDVLASFGLISDDDIARLKSLKLDSSGKSLRIKERIDGTRDAIALLALGFDKGEPRAPIVPYGLVA